jgi:hypothetical protein
VKEHNLTYIKSGLKIPKGWIAPPICKSVFPYPDLRSGKDPNLGWLECMKYPSNFKRGERLVSIRCGWCGNNTFAWEETTRNSLSNLDKETGGGTTCCFCGRDLQLWYKNWIYHAEFSDGCRMTQWKLSDDKVGCSSCGPHHAPHLAFVPSDFPIIEWGEPDLSDKDFIYYGFRGSTPTRDFSFLNKRESNFFEKIKTLLNIKSE